MNTARRTLNILAALFILVAGAGLALFIVQGSPKNIVPFTFVAAFALAPALAHLVAAAWAWPSASIGRGRAVWGLGLSSASFFAWAVIAAVLVELALRDPSVVLDLPRVALAIGMLLLLPLSAAANFMCFRRVLVLNPQA